MIGARTFSRLTDRWLLAGGNWNNSSNCGSRARNANNYRWNSNSNIGSRFAADTGESETPGWICQPCRGIPGRIHDGGTGGIVATGEIHPVRIDRYYTFS